MFDKGKDLNNVSNLKPVKLQELTKKEEKEIDGMENKEIEEKKEEEQIEDAPNKLFVLTFEINEANGSVVIQATTIGEAIAKFLVKYGEDSHTWVRATLTIDEAVVL